MVSFFLLVVWILQRRVDIMRITTYSVELDNDQSVLVKRGAVNYNSAALTRADLVVTMMNSLFRVNRKAEEHVYILGMNTKCKVVGTFLLSKGTMDSSIVVPRDIFIRVCLCGAGGFIMVHNHPSGSVIPSKEDICVTKRIKECSELMGIRFLDHIIIGDGYYSFKEFGDL
jgi:DNA repair protein RadC